MPQFRSPQNLWPLQSGQSKPTPQYPAQPPSSTPFQETEYRQQPDRLQQASYQPPMQPVQQPPKKHIVRTIGCGSLVVLIVLMVMIAAASNHGRRSSASMAVGSPSPSTSRQQSTAPPPQPSVAVNYVGELIVVDSTWMVTVNSVKTSKGDRTFTPNSGDIYMIVDVTVKNTSSSSQEVASVGNFTIKDGAGEPYLESFTDVGPPPDGTIGAGKLLRGQLVYEVPSSQHIFTFMFQPDFTGSAISEWTLYV